MAANLLTSRDVIKADRYLRERIENDSARFYVLSRLSGVISHQKVYLLKADDGRTRVIFGSPNLSGRAFNGTVLEFIGYCDDRTLYEHLWTAFQILRDDASSEILKKGEVISPGESSVEELPITKRIRTEKTILVKEADNELGSKINYAIKVNESWEKKTEEFCKSVRIKDSNVGYTLVTSDHLEKMLAKKRENEQKRRVRFRSDPQFVLDYYEQTVTYNGVGYDLRRMFPRVNELIEQILKPIQEFDNMQWVPDIFNISAQVLREMILEYVGNIPESFREFTWRDYMGTEARSSKALDLLKKDYALMPEIFRRQKDKIYIDYSKNTKNLDRIKEELPVAMAARVTNSTLIIDRKAAEDYMGIHIRYKLRKR